MRNRQVTNDWTRPEFNRASQYHCVRCKGPMPYIGNDHTYKTMAGICMACFENRSSWNNVACHVAEDNGHRRRLSDFVRSNPQARQAEEAAVQASAEKNPEKAARLRSFIDKLWSFEKTATRAA